MEPKNTFFSRKLTIKCRGEIIDLSEPKVMGILNLTPDSFYDGGKYSTPELIFEKVSKMVAEGCDMLDIGACSTRPGAAEVSESEELKRLVPVLNQVKLLFPDLLVSVDTFRSEVARIVVNDYLVDIINDISAGDMDSKMLETIASLNVPYIMMHMQGTPKNMQQNPQYKNVVQEVIKYFSEKVNKSKLLGINDIIIDPGFGFGKTIDHNYQLINYLADFMILELPILVGLSRKSMIYKFLNTTPEEALNATTVLNTIALHRGANILRVHDVREAKEAITLFQKLSTAIVENWHE
ncbi:MAG: dihydropteroate synthase [Bacteroidetes bacterium GWF2_33_16]|nr:MAG: dihydropteroate synthase [Bacteroidetes bacterium GWE2_32_14]OFY07283.1 MAG: dihydropteroate synthase [Bacteroidetes bacterium GWF2_33_16]